MGLQLGVLAGAATAASGTKKAELTGAGDTTAATATTDATGVSQTGGDCGTMGSQLDPLQQLLGEEEYIDQCGIEADHDTYEKWTPQRIKECRLTSDEKAKFQGHLDLIFDEKTIMGRRIVFDPDDVIEVTKKVQEYLKAEPMLIDDLPFGITVVGDLFGQLYDLDRVFFNDEKDGKKGWECMKYLFLGNYVDKGRQSIEIVMALFCLKMLYPDRIFLLRGNHEFVEENKKEGLLWECGARYEKDTAHLLFYACNEAFCYLSAAAIVGDNYFCSHSGICPEGRYALKGIVKPYFLCDEDFIIHNIVYAEPAEGLSGLAFNNVTGKSSLFGCDAFCDALDSNEVGMVIRGHTKLKNGWSMTWHTCCSIFSATDVAGSNNHGGVAVVDAEGKISIRVLKVDPERAKWEMMLRVAGKPKKEHGDKKNTADLGDGGIKTDKV